MRISRWARCQCHIAFSKYFELNMVQCSRFFFLHVQVSADTQYVEPQFHCFELKPEFDHVNILMGNQHVSVVHNLKLAVYLEIIGTGKYSKSLP